MTRRPITTGRSGDRTRGGPPRSLRARACARPLVLATLLLAATAADAVMSGTDWEAKSRRDPDLAAAATAVEKEDWSGAISILERVVERRPWDDDAFTLLGFAYRKRGDYERSLGHYRRALELNPHHLGALEYMGEAYVESGRPERARELLRRIEITCRRTHGDANWRDRCDEWRELAEAIGKAR